MIALWARRWLLFAIGVPIAAWALDQVRERIERRRGHSGLTRTLHKASDGMRRMRRGGRRRR